MRDKIKIAILSEGKKGIGYGHISRTSALLEIFNNMDLNPLMIINGEGNLSTIFDFGFENLDWTTQKNELFRLIDNSDIVIIDSYLADKDLYEEISKYSVVSVFFDDYQRVSYPEGIIINSAVYAEKLQYPQDKNRIYLLGVEYQPYRNEFRNISEKKVKEKIESVIIFLGANDIRDLIPGILYKLKGSYPEIKKNVIVNKVQHNIAEIESYKDQNLFVHYEPDSAKMVKIMLSSDIAISAGGQTLCELARVGIPSIVISTAENQLLNIQGWQEKGFAKYIGEWNNSKTLDELEQSIHFFDNYKIRDQIYELSRQMIDGQGAKRIVKSILNNYLNNILILKKADINSIDDIFSLSNDKVVRKNSLNQQQIRYEDHKKWFAEKIHSNDCLFLIAEIKSEFAGQIRFDIKESEIILNISIISSCRGLGIGEKITCKGLNILKSEFPDTTAVNAYVRKENHASMRMFEKAGFRLSGFEEDEKIAKFVYHYI